MRKLTINEAVSSCCGEPTGRCRCHADNRFADWLKQVAERQRRQDEDLLPVPGAQVRPWLIANVQPDPDPDAPLPPAGVKLAGVVAVNVADADADADILLPPAPIVW